MFNNFCQETTLSDGKIEGVGYLNKVSDLLENIERHRCA